MSGVTRTFYYQICLTARKLHREFKFPLGFSFSKVRPAPLLAAELVGFGVGLML